MILLLLLFLCAHHYCSVGGAKQTEAPRTLTGNCALERGALLESRREEATAATATKHALASAGTERVGRITFESPVSMKIIENPTVSDDDTRYKKKVHEYYLVWKLRVEVKAFQLSNFTAPFAKYVTAPVRERRHWKFENMSFVSPVDQRNLVGFKFIGRWLQQVLTILTPILVWLDA